MKIISSFKNVLFDSCDGEIFNNGDDIYIYIYQEMSVSDQVGKCVCMCVCMCVGMVCWCAGVGWGLSVCV